MQDQTLQRQMLDLLHPLSRQANALSARLSVVSAIAHLYCLIQNPHGTCFMQVASKDTQHTHSNMSVSDFIAFTLPLLEMEKSAEVAQVMMYLLFLIQ